MAAKKTKMMSKKVNQEDYLNIEKVYGFNPKSSLHLLDCEILEDGLLVLELEQPAFCDEDVPKTGDLYCIFSNKEKHVCLCFKPKVVDIEEEPQKDKYKKLLSY